MCKEVVWQQMETHTEGCELPNTAFVVYQISVATVTMEANGN